MGDVRCVGFCIDSRCVDLSRGLGEAPMTEPKPTEALLGCPFCGGEAQLHDSDWCEPPEWSIYCSVCSAITPGNTDKTLAVATWNRRAAVPSPAIPEPTEAEIDAVAAA